MNKKILKVKDQSISTFCKNDECYISLTDIARINNYDEPKDIVKNWFRN
jgi:hypothetical protein